MANCEPHSDRLFDFVYGLLDETEAQALRGHVEVCPRCQETLRSAQAQHTLFARAALPIGPDAVPAFSPPAEEPPAVDAPALDGKPVAEPPATLAFTPPAAVAPGVRHRARRRYWFAGAAAAAVLLIVGALTYAYQDGVAERQQAVVKQREVIGEIDRHLAALEPEFRRQAKELEVKLRAQAPPHLYMLAPARISPEGAVVQVAVNGPDGKPMAAKVKLDLTDAEGKKVLDHKEVVAQRGTASVALGGALGDALRAQTPVHLVAEAQTDGTPARLDQQLKVAAPAYVAHLMTNQGVYRPGELLLYRALILDRASLTPPLQPIALRFSLLDGKGRVLAERSTATGDGGIATGEMAVVDSWPDGPYELRVAALQPGTAEVRPHARKLQLARDSAQVAQADRSVYRAGDIVNLNVPRSQVTQNWTTNNVPPNAELFLNERRVPLLNYAPGYGGQLPRGQSQGGGGFGTPPPPMPVAPPSAGAQVPGAPARTAPAMGGPAAQPSGNFGPDVLANQMNFQFALPKDLDTSHVRVRIVLTEGKVRETFEQELAVVPARLSVDFFPEGGDLIAGVPNRVYYRVRTPRGEPVNPDGRVIVLSGTDVLLDSAPGAGTGAFTFTPQVGESYSVRITKPGSSPIEQTEPFARFGGVRPDGLVLHTPRPVAAEGEAVDVVLRNPGPARRVLLVAQCRGRFVGQQWVEANGAEIRVAMGTLPGANGLVRLTVYDAGAGTLRPLAERLIYRTPARRLDLAVLHLGGVIAPKYGQKSVQLAVRCRDEAGEPTAAWTNVAIVADDAVRGREPNPVSHFFIAGDVQNGEDLDNAALFAADKPAAQQALDLFLGTVGWRRFQTAAGDVNAVGAPADAAFIGRENDTPRNLRAQLEAKIEEGLVPLRVAMQQQHAQWSAERQTAQLGLTLADASLREFEALPRTWFRIGLGVSTLALLGLACVILAVGAWRLVRRHSATPLFVGSFACLSLCLIAAVVLVSLAPPTEHGSQSMVANGTTLPGRLDLGRVLDAPAGLPTGPLAMAGVPTQEAEKAPQEPRAADAAKAEEQRRIQLEALAMASRDQARGTLRQPRTHLATSKQQQELRREVLQRYEQARLQQQVGGAGKATAAPMTKPKAPAMAPAPAGKGGSEKTDKRIVKTAEEKSTLETTRRAFIPDFVAGVEFDTLLWHPALFVNGDAAEIAFDVPPSAGSYRVLLFANTADGRLGFYEGRLEVQPELLGR